MTRFVHPTADVDSGASVGDGTRVWHQAQVMPRVRVGNDCVLGKGAYLGVGTTLGDQVKVGNGAHLFGATIADKVIICPGALLLEDPHPRATTVDGHLKRGGFEPHPVTVDEGASVGAGAVLAPGTTIAP